MCAGLLCTQNPACRTRLPVNITNNPASRTRLPDQNQQPSLQDQAARDHYSFLPIFSESAIKDQTNTTKEQRNNGGECRGGLTCGWSKQHHIQSLDAEFLLVSLVLDSEVSAEEGRFIGCDPITEEPNQ